MLQWIVMYCNLMELVLSFKQFSLGSLGIFLYTIKQFISKSFYSFLSNLNRFISFAEKVSWLEYIVTCVREVTTTHITILFLILGENIKFFNIRHDTTVGFSNVHYQVENVFFSVEFITLKNGKGCYFSQIVFNLFR